jgi:hypothetical protein
MQTLLLSVFNQIPRVFVNVVTMFNISQVPTISQGHPYCEFFHQACLCWWSGSCVLICASTQTFDECPDLKSEATRQVCGFFVIRHFPHVSSCRSQHMDLFAAGYNDRLYQLAATWQAAGHSNFTVVVQPFTQDMIIQTIDDVSGLCSCLSLLFFRSFCAHLRC